MRRYQRPSSESTLHEMVCDYLRLRYPYVIFLTDSAAGMKLTMGQAIKRKRLNSSRALPDIFIAHPVSVYHGLWLELKREGTVIYKKDGSLRSDEHLREQAIMMNKLELLGYEAQFAVGFEQARIAIDDYFARNI